MRKGCTRLPHTALVAHKHWSHRSDMAQGDYGRKKAVTGTHRKCEAEFEGKSYTIQEVETEKKEEGQSKTQSDTEQQRWR